MPWVPLLAPLCCVGSLMRGTRHHWPPGASAPLISLVAHGTCSRPLLIADLDHHNAELRAGLVDWLNWLHREIGFEGWRFDFVRGYAPKYCCE